MFEMKGLPNGNSTTSLLATRKFTRRGGMLVNSSRGNSYAIYQNGRPWSSYSKSFLFLNGTLLL